MKRQKSPGLIERAALLWLQYKLQGAAGALILGLLAYSALPRPDNRRAAAELESIKPPFFLGIREFSAWPGR